MTAHLCLAPAGAGKTTYAVGLAREAAEGLEGTPRAVVSSRLQVRAWRRRLAEMAHMLKACRHKLFLPIVLPAQQTASLAR